MSGVHVCMGRAVGVLGVLGGHLRVIWMIGFLGMYTI